MVQEAILRLVGLKLPPHGRDAWLQEFRGLGSLGMLLPSDGSNTGGELDAVCILFMCPLNGWV